MDNGSYYERVYEVTRKIPHGRVSTYGAIADYLALGSARMVGWALHQCAYQENVPAHRVVNRLGHLSGRIHFSPPSRMQELLEKEGHLIKNDTIQEFKKVFWHPGELENY